MLSKPPIGHLIYLASPYNHPLKYIRQKRYELVRDVTMHLMNLNHVIYSPIVHMHHIDLISEFPRDWDFFKKFDEVMLTRCNELWILDIQGWDLSKGIGGEIRIAKEFNIPISLAHFDFETDTFTKAKFDYVI